ncbi:MAG: hypothetical protein MZV63_61635 [Marinilabiliales bacterium]|nr:hypothetical protein [Marinilabiliales bacterium]
MILRKVLKKAPEGSLRKYWKLAIGGVDQEKPGWKRRVHPCAGTIDKSHPVSAEGEY